MGPTGLDLAYELLSCSPQRTVTLGSRTGLTSWVRPGYDTDAEPVWLKPGVLERFVAFNPAPLRLRELAPLILNEFSMAGVDLDEIDRVRGLARLPPRMSLAVGLEDARRAPPYFTALKRLDRITPHLWNAADEAAKRVIWDNWRTEFGRISYAVPPVVAERVLRLLESGRLKMRGRLASVRENEAGRLVAVWHEGLEAFDLVINATGGGGRLDRLDSPLVQQMSGEGLLVPNAFAGAQVAFQSGQALDARNRPIPGLYVLAGTLTQGVHFFVNALTQVHGSCKRTSAAVVDDLLAAEPAAARRRASAAPLPARRATGGR